MPRRRITFRQLETFATVARLGSFSRAAEALHLTQPAVSLQIRQIADTLGLPLFEQLGRQVILTDAGEELQVTVRALECEWDRLESAIEGLKGLRRGKLRVALVNTAKYFLPRLLGAFTQCYPDLEIALEIGHRAQIVERLRQNLDDLTIMSLPPDDLPIVAIPFLDNPYVVIAPLGHPAIGRKVPLAALAREDFLLREAGSGSRLAVDTHLQALGVRLRVRLSLASNEAIRDLVAAGLGLAILSQHALGARPAQDGIAILDVEGFPLLRSWYAVHRAGKRLSLPVQAFMKALATAGLPSS